ncbi:protein translocase subunit SecD [Brachybacterium sp. AOP25-B2-12]|uniref:protein translocase subunit SecD n=1 Tax=Brachybacterium sp. AOP25-B2-12 TaxID=3457710 RepID=UPI004033723F
MPARRTALAVIALILLVLGGGIGAGTWKGGWDPAPKLALDLEGGTQVILKAQSRTGEPIDSTTLEQARQIMSQRINALGVAETEISIQGGSNIVVDVPGTIDQQTSDALRKTALMAFRPVLAVGAGEGAPSDGGGASDAGAASDGGGGPSTTASVSGTAGTAGASDAGGASDGQGASAAGGADASSGVAAWSPDQLTPEAQQIFLGSSCTDRTTLAANAEAAAPSDLVVLCDEPGTTKYLLGPEVITGTGIQDSSVGPQTNSTGQATGGYVVNVSFTGDAAPKWGAMTTALYGGEGATNQLAIVLDSEVISAPQVTGPSTTSTSIEGDFTQDEAQQLSDQLRFGALPLQFTVQSEQQISATLGSDQLEKGLIAGLIGLVLVVLYAIAQYRVLAIVTTASLGVMGLLAYGIITTMSNIPDIGYRLSLAGVAGLIVAIGFTADSFIVYFERVRDEIRDGRGIVSAVDHGWSRARRTIVASDTVNIIAAVVLYVLSTGSVRGFAFTLGLTTLLDLLVVFLFTHPLLQSLVRTRFFGKGHPLSGLDPLALGRDLPAYAGRGRVRTTEERRRRDAEDEEQPRESLAARKARLVREAETTSGGPGTDAAGPATDRDDGDAPDTRTDTDGEEKTR